MDSRSDHRRAAVGVVLATRDRRESLLRSLAHLRAIPERPPVVVADNGSSDGSAQAVEERFPDVAVVRLGRNLGAGARTVAAKRLTSPYVAFADDDSWWAPGALDRAAAALDAHPRLALVAARILVGEEERADPVCEAMAAAPLGADADLPGPNVLGFLACGAIVRRDAFLAAGGFDGRFGVGGEEEVLAFDLAAAGWGLCYLSDVVAHHHPSPARDPQARRRIEVRNALWAAWLRRRGGGLARRTVRIGAPALRDGAGRAGLAEAVGGLPWVLRGRRRIPPALELAARTLDA